jgi:hypothetical protein
MFASLRSYEILREGHVTYYPVKRAGYLSDVNIETEAQRQALLASQHAPKLTCFAVHSHFRRREEFKRQVMLAYNKLTGAT